jgi:hypothetical protein
MLKASSKQIDSHLIGIHVSYPVVDSLEGLILLQNDGESLLINVSERHL